MKFEVKLWRMFAEARALLQAGLTDRAYPAAVIEVGRRSGSLWQEAFGRLTYDEHSQPCRLDTMFDLASLTKVISTASLIMRHVGAGHVALSSRLSDLIPTWRDDHRGFVTMRHLLDHSSGLPARAPLWERGSGREFFQTAICRLPLERAPGAQSVYSDLGFMLLGFILEDLSRRSLADEFASVVASHAEGVLTYLPPVASRDRIAPTENDPWRGRVLCGEVHDENAAAIGGAAGHAGLFGTVTAVGAFARTVLATFDEESWLGAPSLMLEFAKRSAVPGSSRALAWDTMLPTSSSGRLMSPTAIGHTGFTGTSLWIDYERDAYVALLTNRVHPTRTNDAFVAMRPRVHDAVMREVLMANGH